MFCQQDRAILCRDCDHPIHSANEHTQKHNRFLLTGVKLSATKAIYGSSSSDISVPNPKMTDQSSSHKKSVSVSPAISKPPNSVLTKNSASSTSTATTTMTNYDPLTNDEVGLTSSISEYLIETLPGWHVEDFLDSSSVAFGFCKVRNQLILFYLFRCFVVK